MAKIQPSYWSRHDHLMSVLARDWLREAIEPKFDNFKAPSLLIIPQSNLVQYAVLCQYA